MAAVQSFKLAFSPDFEKFKEAGAKAARDFTKNFRDTIDSSESITDALGSKRIKPPVIEPPKMPAMPNIPDPYSPIIDQQTSKLEKLRSIGSNAGGVLVGAGKLAAKGTLAASAAVASLGGAAIAATASIQQSLGGADAVFEKSSGSIKNWAGQAAGAMGISTNEALEVANKMGSLFQGAGHSVDKSAEMTMGYAQRAADVASIMGVDLSSAMEAVTGAAKGNYTMMDNLGVAMNDTTLAAYAQEKGITGLWKNMDNAQKTGIAYQMFMEKTAKYEGNFVKENNTLAGSFDILKSSWSNVLQSVSDPEMLKGAITQLNKAITGAMTSLLSALPSIVQGIGTILKDGLPMLLASVVTLLPELVKMIKELLPPLIEAIIGILPGLIDAVLNGIVELLPVVLDAIILIIVKVAEMLPEIISKLMPAIMKAISILLIALVKLLANLPAILGGVWLGIMGVFEGIGRGIIGLMSQEAQQGLADFTNGIGPWFATMAQGFAKGFNDLDMTITNFIMSALASFGNWVMSIINGFPGFVSAIAGFFVNMWNQINGAFIGVQQAIIGFFIGVIAQIVAAGVNAGVAMRDFGLKILNGISEAYNNVVGFISNTFNTIASKIGQAIGDTTHIGAEIINGIWEGFKANIGAFFGNITGFGQSVISKFKEIFNIHSPSRVMRDEVGKNIGLGVGVGLTGATKTVLGDAEKFSSNISKAVSIGSSFDITPNEDSFLGRGVQSGTQITVQQTVEQPKNLMDMYVMTKRGAIAGTAAAGGF